MGNPGSNDKPEANMPETKPTTPTKQQQQQERSYIAAPNPSPGASIFGNGPSKDKDKDKDSTVFQNHFGAMKQVDENAADAQEDLDRTVPKRDVAAGSDGHSSSSHSMNPQADHPDLPETPAATGSAEDADTLGSDQATAPTHIFVRPHVRKAYYRSDGTLVRASRVKEHWRPV